jgi:hypothetical protein
LTSSETSFDGKNSVKHTEREKKRAIKSLRKKTGLFHKKGIPNLIFIGHSPSGYILYEKIKAYGIVTSERQPGSLIPAEKREDYFYFV